MSKVTLAMYTTYVTNDDFPRLGSPTKRLLSTNRPHSLMSSPLLWQDSFPLHPINASDSELAIGPLLARLWHDLLSVEYTFWGNLARVTLQPHLLDSVLMWWGRCCLAVSLIACLRRPEQFRGQWRELTLFLSWPAMFLGMLALFWSRRQAFLFGRLVFPALPATMVILFWG